MSEPNKKESLTQSDERGETEAALRYLREHLPPDIFEGLRFNSRKLTMRDAELIVRGWEDKTKD